MSAWHFSSTVGDKRIDALLRESAFTEVVGIVVRDMTEGNVPGVFSDSYVASRINHTALNSHHGEGISAAVILLTGDGRVVSM
jgi:hypothetical protein